MEILKRELGRRDMEENCKGKDLCHSARGELGRPQEYLFRGVYEGR